MQKPRVDATPPSFTPNCPQEGGISIREQITYSNRNHALHGQYTPIPNEKQAQPIILYRRIGSTTYEVSVHFSKTSKERIEDKMIRLIKNELEKEALTGE